MSPRSGLDMDHWFRQSSNMITFSTVLKICWSISGCISSTFRNMSLLGAKPTLCFLPGYTGTSIIVKSGRQKAVKFVPFCVSCLNKYVTMWSNVAQQPVQTIVSTIARMITTLREQEITRQAPIPHAHISFDKLIRSRSYYTNNRTYFGSDVLKATEQPRAVKLAFKHGN